MNTKHSIGFLLDNELNEAFHVDIGLGTGVCHEGELSDLIFNTSCFELLLSLADPCDFRMSVDNGGDGVVVYVSVTRFDVLSNSNTYTTALISSNATIW